MKNLYLTKKNFKKLTNDGYVYINHLLKPEKIINIYVDNKLMGIYKTVSITVTYIQDILCKKVFLTKAPYYTCRYVYDNKVLFSYNGFKDPLRDYKRVVKNYFIHNNFNKNLVKEDIYMVL